MTTEQRAELLARILWAAAPNHLRDAIRNLGGGWQVTELLDLMEQNNHTAGRVWHVIGDYWPSGDGDEADAFATSFWTQLERCSL